MRSYSYVAGHSNHSRVGSLSEATGRSLAHCKAGCSCCKETALRRMGRLTRVIIFARLPCSQLQRFEDTAMSKSHCSQKVPVPQIGCLTNKLDAAMLTHIVQLRQVGQLVSSRPGCFRSCCTERGHQSEACTKTWTIALTLPYSVSIHAKQRL